jgi:hypothetical protein
MHSYSSGSHLYGVGENLRVHRHSFSLAFLRDDAGRNEGENSSAISENKMMSAFTSERSAANMLRLLSQFESECGKNKEPFIYMTTII